ncbi:MAG TPA: arylesterase [Candidatus Binatia bacterium]|nr:arylesterase [Candidatus Binatia bacterium]
MSTRSGRPPRWQGGFALSLLLVVALAGPALGQEPVIVAFGDSLTAGLGVPPEDAYPARLQARLRAAGYPHRVVNAGVSGDTTAGGLRRVEWALKHQPAIVILELGANDGLRGQSVAGIRANLEQMVRKFQAAGARVLVAGMRLPPNYGQYAGEFGRVYAQVAKSTGAPLVPFFLDGVAGEARLNQPDGIHPTSEGYQLVVDRIWPYLEPLLRR